MSLRKSRIESGSTVFRFLDRRADIEKTHRHLPHWFQVGAAIFVTYRTADSMPLEVMLRFQRELEHWLYQNNLPLELAQSPNEAAIVPNCVSPPIKVTPHQLSEFRKLRARAWHRSLDQCHGACLLKRQHLARIVAESLLFHDGEKYDLDSFVIMPNHVHAIVQFRPGASLETISQSWMRYTARQINAEIGKKGGFWQPEPFDHIIRNGNQFSYLQSYIVDNPTKAKLRDGEYLYWQPDQ